MKHCAFIMIWRNIMLSVWFGETLCFQYDLEKHCAFSMIWKATNKTFSVQYWHVQDSATLLGWNYLQRWYLLFSLMSWVLFSSNSFHKAGQPDVICRNMDKVTWSCAKNRAWTPALPGHWSLHYDNSAAHWLLCVKQFMAKKIYCWSWLPPLTTFDSFQNTECFKKSFTNLKAYRNLYRGYTQRFELSKCSKTHRVLPRIVIRNCFDLFFWFLLPHYPW
jgi:hypothetical protein